jgi:hypothetical protein
VGKLSLVKGHNFEREVAQRLNQTLGFSDQDEGRFKRVLVETREGNSGDVRSSRYPLVVQCKVGERPPIYDALDEAAEAALGDMLPFAAIRRNRRGKRPMKELGVFRLEDALMLLGGGWRAP